MGLLGASTSGGSSSASAAKGIKIGPTDSLESRLAAQKFQAQAALPSAPAAAPTPSYAPAPAMASPSVSAAMPQAQPEAPAMSMGAPSSPMAALGAPASVESMPPSMAALSAPGAAAQQMPGVAGAADRSGLNPALGNRAYPQSMRVLASLGRRVY